MKIINALDQEFLRYNIDWNKLLDIHQRNDLVKLIERMVKQPLTEDLSLEDIVRTTVASFVESRGALE